MQRFLLYASVLVLLGLTSCEKGLVAGAEDAISDSAQGDACQSKNVILHIVQFEWTEQREPCELARTWPSRDGQRRSQHESFTRSATDITDLCSRLNIALFDANGTKVKTVAQKEGDASFGTVALTLAAGTYRLVVIAHSCDGSATITSEEKVTFPNNKVTDTFYYDGDLVVTDAQQSYDLTLTRAVAMFRLVLTDEEMPSNVAKLKFYYLGGSSTFSPKAGYGCVNSKQTEMRTVTEDGIYDIYTLPHSEEDVLTKLTVTALDANDNTIMEHIFEDIPVTRNQITRYTGSFFGNGGGVGGGTIADGTFRLTANPEWDNVNDFTF